MMSTISFEICGNQSLNKYRIIKVIMYILLVLLFSSSFYLIFSSGNTIASVVLIVSLLFLCLSPIVALYYIAQSNKGYVKLGEKSICIYNKSTNEKRIIDFKDVKYLSTEYEGFFGDTYWSGNRLSYKSGIFNIKIRLKEEDFELTVISKSDNDAKKLKDYFFSVLKDSVPCHLKLYEQNYTFD